MYIIQQFLLISLIMMTVCENMPITSIEADKCACHFQLFVRLLAPQIEHNVSFQWIFICFNF